MIMVRRRWTIGEVVQRLLGGRKVDRGNVQRWRKISVHIQQVVMSSQMDESVALGIRIPLANETFRIVESRPWPPPSLDGNSGEGREGVKKGLTVEKY